MNSISRILLFLTFILLINGCKKDDDSLSDSPSNQSGTMITTDFSGFVKDIQGNPVAGAVVSVGGKTAMTNSTGGYKIESASVNKKRAVVEVNKSGYWLQQKGTIAESGVDNRVNLVIFPENKAYNVSGASGGTITLTGGTTITFQANAFETSNGSVYSGTVYITAYDLLTSETDFSEKIPGGDLMAKDNGGNETLLQSYGMSGAKLYDAAGGVLHLVAGKSATIKFPVVSAQSGSAPSSIPLWHYDEMLQMWKMEGMAIRNGNFYEGNVTHFSWWNCDIPVSHCQLTIHVINCLGLPVFNREIRVTSSNFGTAYGYTSSGGNCSGIIPANETLLITIRNPVTNTVDTTFTIGPFAPNSNQTFSITISGGNCNSLQVNITDCSGSPINGTVAVFNNGIYTNIYTATNGVVSISPIAPGNYTFYAASGSLAGTDSIVIGSAGMSTITIPLCDTIQSGINNFNATITSATLGTINISMANVTARFQLISGIKHVILTYVDSISQDSGSIYIKTPGYAPGTYNWNNFDSNVSGTLIYNGMPFAIGSITSSGFTLFTATPPVGSNIVGEFSGMMNLSVNGINTVATVNASFDAIRTQ